MATSGFRDGANPANHEYMRRGLEPTSVPVFPATRPKAKRLCASVVPKTFALVP
jgi:hypothetical protein